MIITKEKYRHFNIVYIDESKDDDIGPYLDWIPSMRLSGTIHFVGDSRVFHHRADRCPF